MASSSPTAQVYLLNGSDAAVTLREPAETLAERVPEAFIQDLWAQQQFDADACTTTTGEPLHVLDPGTLNTDAGPDFRDAHLRIGTMEWHGDVEIHNQSHTWIAHDHPADTRYNSVVLHVVLAADMWTGRLTRSDGSPLPELVLGPVLTVPLRKALHEFLTREDNPLLCATQWANVPASTRSRWIRRLGRSRLQSKADALTEPTAQVLFERLCAAMGYAKNADPMTTLAQRCPLSFLQTLPDIQTIEAALFGWAGLLPTPNALVDADRDTADYVMRLRDRFRRLRTSHSAEPLPREQWTYFRLRPNNFPSLRLAQIAQWVAPDGGLRTAPLASVQDALHEDNPRAALHTFLASEPGPFWQTHRRLDRVSKSYRPALGTRRRDTLILNAIVPLLLRHPDAATDAVWPLIEDLPVASDRITRIFNDLGSPPDTALAAQGMHQLYRQYCTQGRCLQCAIGDAVLTSNS